MTNVATYGWIDEKGILHLYGRKRLDAELKKFKPCDVVVTIKKKGKRTTQANNYYRCCIVKELQLNFRERGIDMDDEQVHEFLKLHFNKQYIHDDNGQVIGEYGGSTAEMNKDEISDYMERIIIWCGDKLGLVIEPPNTQTKMFE